MPVQPGLNISPGAINNLQYFCSAGWGARIGSAKDNQNSHDKF
jgi:hypothetical protein